MVGELLTDDGGRTDDGRLFITVGVGVERLGDGTAGDTCPGKPVSMGAGRFFPEADGVEG